MRRLSNQVKYLIIHHFGGSDSNPLADTSNQTFAVVNEYHRQKWNYVASNRVYCGYHYVIEKSGKIVSATPENEEGIHTIGKNLESLGIALAGNFDATLPTEAQKEALRGLLVRLGAKYKVTYDKIVPHRTFSSKTCYGKKLSDTWAADLFLGDRPSELQYPEFQSQLDRIKKIIEELLKKLGIKK